MKIDLHTHSNKSDGTMSPTELVQHAIINGIDLIGITDHDTIAGWSEATSAIRGDFQLAPGAEISCLTEDHKSVHILGLLFDSGYEPLQEVMAASRDDRVPRMRRMIELMADDGFAITFEEVKQHQPEGATLGRPHLADALVAKGIVRNRDQAFAELLNNDSKYYVSHISPTPIEAITLIKAAGGVSVIAHPGASFADIDRELALETFAEYKAAGLSAIEVAHRDHSQAERDLLSAIAKDLELIQSGSSDFHGSGKLNLIGENLTEPEQWEQLASLAKPGRIRSVSNR